MATSGTVGTTLVRINDMIDAGMRRARIPAAAGTPETLQIGLRIIWNYLTSAFNRGDLQFTIDKVILGTVPNQIVYSIPGMVQISNILYRTVTVPTGTAFASSGTASNAFDLDVDTACTNTAPDGHIGIVYSSDQIITDVGILPDTDATWDLVLETSADGVTYETLYAAGSKDYVDKVWTYFDIENPATSSYFRVRETGGGTLAVREISLGTAPNEITIATLNQSQYTSLPNKTAQGSPIVQYYAERRAFLMRFYMWQTANTWFDRIVFWGWRYPMDPGAVNLELEVPPRWQKAIIDMVAFELAVEVGGVNGIPLDYVAFLGRMADRSTFEAENEEIASGNQYVSLGIGIYTS